MTEILNWFQGFLDLYGEQLYFWLTWIAAASVVMFFGSIIISIFIITRLPADYFQHWHDRRQVHDWHWTLHVLWKVLKNSIGVLVLLAGIAMLFLPGQGLLTIMIALMMLDFPGKRHILDHLIAKPKIQDSLNWIRKKRRRLPFRFTSRQVRRR
ncbi:MAG: PGPGW domain-containing protein [Oligoflexus sp.]